MEDVPGDEDDECRAGFPYGVWGWFECRVEVKAEVFRREVKARAGGFGDSRAVDAKRFGERVAHREVDCRRTRDGIVKVGGTSLFMSELCCDRGISIRALSDGNEGSTHSNQSSIQRL